MVDLHPSDGVRMVLELEEEEDSGKSARYRANIYTPDERFSYDATLADSGTVTMTPTNNHRADPPAEGRLENLLKLLARSAKRKREEGLNPWPPRVMRWRSNKQQ